MRFAVLALLCCCVLPVFAETPGAFESDPTGWTDLLADRNPDRWTRLPIPADAPLSDRDQWSYDPATGMLTCDGTGGHDWLRYNQEFRNFILRVEWRFVPRPEGGRYNSGVFVRNSADARIWHQAQTGDASGGFLFGDSPTGGEVKRFNLREASGTSRVLPAGEWNIFEIRAEGDALSLWVNGAVSSVYQPCEVSSGYVGLEAEGFRIEFRRVLLKPLP